MKQSPRGFTLIEMVVVITVGSAVMGMAATTLALLMRAEGEGAESASVSVATSRLARSFRDDVRDAEGAVVDAPRKIRLTQDDARSIQYEADHALLRRTVRQGDSVTHRDEFHLLHGEVRFEVTHDGKVAVLMHTNRSDSTTDDSNEARPVRSLRIEAVLGRNHRHSQPAKAE